jgi:hypothetical protein
VPRHAIKQRHVAGFANHLGTGVSKLVLLKRRTKNKDTPIPLSIR